MKKTQSISFKKCSKCGEVWPERKSFLNDPELRIIAYQPDFEEFMAGLFLFHHNCGTSLAIKADAFKGLYDGPMFKEKLRGTKDCGGCCLHKGDLSHV